MGSHRPRPWAVVGAVVGVVHLAALYWPRITVEGPVSWTDKMVHPVLFLLPLVAWSLWWGRWQPVAVVLAGHAVLSEVLQNGVLPNRSGDPWDAAADLVGVGIGLGIVVPWLRRRRPSAPAALPRGEASSGSKRW